MAHGGTRLLQSRTVHSDMSCCSTKKLRTRTMLGGIQDRMRVYKMKRGHTRVALVAEDLD